MENLEICKKCGGACCKKSGCDYLPKNFVDLSFNGLLKKLEEGNISVVATIIFKKLPNGKMYANPILYLRARNNNREIIDLISMKTTCSMLTDTGCKYSYDERPSMGKNLMPVPDKKCYPLENPNIIIKEWDSYQRVLSKIVKRMTGLTLDEKVKQDVENLFYEVLSNNFEGIDIREVMDIRGLIVPLANCYPDELENAVNRIENKVYTKV